MATQYRIREREYGERLAQAQVLLRETDLDALLVNSNEADFASVRYFSDYWPIFETAGVLIPREGEATLLFGPESETFARDRSRIARIRKMMEYRESSDPAYPGIEVSTFPQVFREIGVPAPRKIGIAGYLVTTLPVADSLRTAFPDASLVRADHIMMALRQVKSEAEVACLREAFRIAEVAVDCVLKSIRPGMTELQVVGIVQRIIYEHGAESEGMPQYVLSGRKTNQAISRPTHKVMQKGELVQLNLSARVDGYSSGVGRPLCLGKMSGHMRELVEFGKLAHERTFGCLRAGVSASAVAADYRRFFIDSGRGGNYLYGPCHGLGMMECEPPWMEEGKDYPLAAGMTFQIDTFVQDADLGLRWENGSLITTDSAELFSNRHMEILELG